MNTISTASLYQTALLNITASEQKEAQAEAQTGSTKIASDLQGYGSNAATLVATNTLQARATSYIANNQTLSSRLEVQNDALSQYATAAQGAASAITSAIANNDGSDLMSTLQTQLSAASSALNTQVDGQYVFGGGQVDTKPVSASNLSDLDAGAVSGLFSNDRNATSNRLNDTTVATTGFLASGVGSPLMTALQSVQQYAQAQSAAGTPIGTTLTTDQAAFLQGVLSTFNGAVTSANATVAQNGSLQAQVSDNITALTDQKTALTSVTGGITDADMAQVATNLTLAQTALQASAQVFSSLQNDSLLNVLSAS